MLAAGPPFCNSLPVSGVAGDYSGKFLSQRKLEEDVSTHLCSHTKYLRN